MPQSPETLSLCPVGLRPPAQAGLTNFLTQPPFTSGQNVDGGKTHHINQWLHPHTPSLEPSPPGEERKLINISLGYEVLPLCMGPATLCINVVRQTWAFVLPPKEDYQTLLPFFCLWTMFTTETLGKELGKEQKTLYIMLLRWLKRLRTLHWNITMTKDFLAGLTVEWHPPPPPGILLDKQIGPKLWNIYKT